MRSRPKLRFADDVPDGYLMISVIPSDYDEGVARLIVTIYTPSRRDLFALWGRTELIERCRQHLEVLNAHYRMATKDFIALLWDLSEHEPTDKALLDTIWDMGYLTPQ